MQTSALLRRFMESGVDDLATVHARFAAWLDQRRREDYDWVLTWVYAWTRRYFLRKFVDNKITSASDAEKLMEEVFFTVHEKHGTVRDPGRFASWVSVICKYRFLNYVRSGRHQEAAEVMAETLGSGDDIEKDVLQTVDVHAVFEGLLSERLEKLPSYVRLVLHKKIWEDKSYDEIGKETGYSVETVRSYFARGLSLLRNEPDIQALKDVP